MHDHRTWKGKYLGQSINGINLWYNVIQTASLSRHTQLQYPTQTQTLGRDLQTGDYSSTVTGLAVDFSASATGGVTSPPSLPSTYRASALWCLLGCSLPVMSLKMDQMLCGLRLCRPSEERIQAHAEDAEEQPHDANNDPAGEELLAEDVAGAVHGHRPQDQAATRVSTTVMVLAILDARRSLVCSASASAPLMGAWPGTISRSPLSTMSGVVALGGSPSWIPSRTWLFQTICG